MKYTFAAFFALMLICCQRRKLITYEEGLENCDKIQEEKKKDNPNGLFFVGADCVIGSRIPEFETTSIEGEKISNELLKGKVSIINFWFISCAPCVAEIPGFNAIVEKFGKDHVNYIAIGRDDKKEIQEFLHKQPWDFKHISNGNEIITNDFKIRWGFPTTFLLDKNAKIVLAISGGKSDSTAVQEIQNKLTPIIERELK